MNTETLKQIAEWAYPDAEIKIAAKNVWVGDRLLPMRLQPSQRLHLQDKYREWVLSKFDREPAFSNKLIAQATESAEALLEAIARDVLGVK
ncbi:MAG: hypothetical protein GQ474_08000 [Sulfurimonas sp.]|nr:hypothetical protein [Sulfurimonas sp.]